MDETLNLEPADVLEEYRVPEEPREVARRWLAEIGAAEKADDKFRKRGDRISKRYRDEWNAQTPVQSGAKFNIFWSNVQTLAPATYSRRPKVEVTRRFRDQDPVARLAGMILERGLQYETDCRDDLHQTMQACVLDRLLPGRAVAWVRYEPSFKKATMEVPTEDGLGVEERETEVLSDERTPVDYVYWRDFLVSPARTWPDVRWIGRQLMFGKEALATRFTESIAKFGGTLADIPLDYDPTKDGDGDAALQPGGRDAQNELDSCKRALVYEICDKESKQRVWVAKGCEFPLDIVDDVFELEDFWPVPKPLLATTTNDKLEPVADYVVYQEQIRELDNITTRISLLISALRVIGVYDASQASLSTLLASGIENRMVAVNSWAAFAEKGGLKGSMDFLPLEMVVKVLEGLYEARDRVKQTVYEITGMADIVRGASVASETLGAQEIKAKFANLRLSSRQQQVAEFVTRLYQIKGHIMCQQYSAETLIRISSIRQLPEAQPDPTTGQPNQKFEQNLQAALALLKDERTRNYRIEVQASSLVELDEVDERTRRNDFMSALSNFMLAMKNITESIPEMAPAALEMLKFVVRGFTVGRSMEAALDDAAEAIQAKIKNPEPPPPDPAIQKAQIDAQASTQLEQMKLSASAQSEQLAIQAERELEMMRLQNQRLIEQDKLASAERIAQMKLQSDAILEDNKLRADSARSEMEIHSNAAVEMRKANPAVEMKPLVQPLTEAITASIEATHEMQEVLARLTENMAKPRIKTPTRDPQTGDIISVEERMGD